jgi:hypothetical protein
MLPSRISVLSMLLVFLLVYYTKGIPIRTPFLNKDPPYTYLTLISKAPLLYFMKHYSVKIYTFLSNTNTLRTGGPISVNIPTKYLL